MGGMASCDLYKCTQIYANPQGEMVAQFVGQCRHNQFNGRGKMVWFDNDRVTHWYEGQWVNGQMDGEGIYCFNGSGSEGQARYQGQFRRNLRDGYGVFTFPDGSLYDGNWRDDMPEGDGRVLYPNGEILRSRFAAGKQDLSGSVSAFGSMPGTLESGPLLGNPSQGSCERPPPPPPPDPALPALMDLTRNAQAVNGSSFMGNQESPPRAMGRGCTDPAGHRAPSLRGDAATAASEASAASESEP
eukprot:CAMPEP_0178456658 /NCGR_PEP_ID=MMETSP0689_2-20121128/46597_1 /TAXON_ID=160604 /ORGANISM="Amphidinium massartii, Strain CS-259" /LENGTH=243 /DNA_ID=CAMNT_0020082849 /DNA_START=80 /DNA_END=808 /DNA_ORIENTATION=+